MYASAWKLYLPLSVAVGVVVALPTLVIHSGVGRGVGVVAVVIGLAFAVTWLLRPRRRHRATTVHQFGGTLSGEVTLSATATQASAAPEAVMRRFRRLHQLLRLWPVLTAAGVLAGALLGAATGSFLLTAAFAALGFLIPNLALMRMGVHHMRRLSTGSSPPS
jgi:hypothetical protein